MTVVHAMMEQTRIAEVHALTHAWQAAKSRNRLLVCETWHDTASLHSHFAFRLNDLNQQI